MGVPSPKIVRNLPRTYEKLHCKGEPYRFSGKQDPLVQTDIDPITFKVFLWSCNALLIAIWVSKQYDNFNLCFHFDILSPKCLKLSLNFFLRVLIESLTNWERKQGQLCPLEAQANIQTNKKCYTLYIIFV